jgi:Flp pilus assembly protein protease CpaA
MPCLIALFALIGPRIALIFTAIFSSMITRAIDNWFVAFLGFLFLPWTTLAYVAVYPAGINGFDYLFLGLGLAFDLFGYFGGGYSNRTRMRTYRA